jgi:hypothetical protein
LASCNSFLRTTATGLRLLRVVLRFLASLISEPSSFADMRVMSIDMETSGIMGGNMPVRAPGHGNGPNDPNQRIFPAFPGSVDQSRQARRPD